jgi:hypothetical protein
LRRLFQQRFIGQERPEAGSTRRHESSAATSGALPPLLSKDGTSLMLKLSAHAFLFGFVFVYAVSI